MSINVLDPKGTLKDFPGSGSQLPNTNIQQLEIPAENTKVIQLHDKKRECFNDIQTLTKTELKEKYKGEYSSHKNMKQRCKNQGYILSPEFESFPDFLSNVGPKKHPNYTIDRIDNDNPTYGPGLVEWRDKYSQNSNKGNNVYLTHDDGRKKTVAQWAKITGQKPDALYKRRKSGWTDMETITGEREHPATDPLDDTPWPYDRRERWERHYQQACSSNPSLSRIEHLCQTAKEQLQRLRQRAIDLADQQDPYDEDPVCTEEYLACMEQLECLKGILHEAQQQYDYERRMTEFVRRSGGHDAAKEKAIFSRLNKRPTFTINKKPE